jgi:predicted metal-dependent enzyme (double-stranded beta helix superfamily)
MADAEQRASEPLDLVLGRPGGCTLQLFVWPRGARTTIHDHSSWGLYACLDGALGEDRYARLDDEAQSGVAHLRREWQTIWTPGQRSALAPYAGGIHRVYNAGLRPAVSLHLYGPPLSAIDGRDYDARSSVVCDRPPDERTGPSRGSRLRYA